jgi:hypothetical protein
MERRSLYIYAAFFIAVAVLLIVAVSDYYAIVSLRKEISLYERQQAELSRFVASMYGADMEAARNAWVSANRREYVSLQNQGITIEADTIATQGFTLILDLQEPSGTRLDNTPGSSAPGEAIVYLGQYYMDNMTRVPGWAAAYRVNLTTHQVAGLTSLTAQSVAYQYYEEALASTIHEKLGVTGGSIAGSSVRHIDCSYLPESGNWVDVAEYRYSIKGTGLKPYLLIKTYINDTDMKVAGVEISMPYYASVTGIDY